MAERPDPRKLGSAKSVVTGEKLAVSRNPFIGWWEVLRRLKLKTGEARSIGQTGIPGACVGTLKHQLAGLSWRVLTEDGEETPETAYYTLLLEQARDADGTVIGLEGFVERLAGDVLMANEGANYEIFRVPRGPFRGVPVNLLYIDGAQMQPTGNPKMPYRQYIDRDNVVLFDPFSIGRVRWESYQDARLVFYNLHPVIKAYVAISMLSAEDDYQFELMTQIIPQGIMNLGSGFDRKKALEWKAGWEAAKVGGKLNDIALLYGSADAEFIPFNPPPSDLPFSESGYWYLTTLTALFEMSPFDLGFMTQINTKAGSEMTVEVSRGKGIKHLTTVIQCSLEQNVLPEGLVMEFEDIDPVDDLKDSQVRANNAAAISDAVKNLWITPAQAVEEARRLGVFDVSTPEMDAEEETNKKPEPDPTPQQDDMVADTVAKAIEPWTPRENDDSTVPAVPVGPVEINDYDQRSAYEYWNSVMEEELAGLLNA